MEQQAFSLETPSTFFTVYNNIGEDSLDMREAALEAISKRVLL
jgi:hypothetical protein